jgi:hypothetical protein
MLLVQWRGGRNMIIDPQAHTDARELELTAGWRPIAASFHML